MYIRRLLVGHHSAKCGFGVELRLCGDKLQLAPRRFERWGVTHQGRQSNENGFGGSENHLRRYPEQPQNQLKNAFGGPGMKSKMPSEGPESIPKSLPKQAEWAPKGNPLNQWRWPHTSQLSGADRRDVHIQILGWDGQYQSSMHL